MSRLIWVGGAWVVALYAPEVVAVTFALILSLPLLSRILDYGADRGWW